MNIELEIEELITLNIRLKQPVKIIFEREGIHYIVFNRDTNQYGIGSDPFEARRDFEENFFQHYQYLKDNESLLGSINEEEWQFFNRIF